MDKLTHEVRLEQWERLMANCAKSGLPKKQWCLENGISEKRFYYWQRKLRKKAYVLMTMGKGSEAGKEKLPAMTERTEIPFVEIRAAKDESSDRTDFRPDAIIRSGEMKIEISNSACASLIQELGGLLHAQ